MEAAEIEEVTYLESSVALHFTTNMYILTDNIEGVRIIHYNCDQKFSMCSQLPHKLWGARGARLVSRDFVRTQNVFDIHRSAKGEITTCGRFQHFGEFMMHVNRRRPAFHQRSTAYRYGEDGRRYAVLMNIDRMTQQIVWGEFDYRLDVCRVTQGAHKEHLYSVQKR
ncbi:hypothetical protein AVEN_235325-1 [Araneus ventricosus]|uniref:Uncharacterized protein n=1 Tax=Araneus ventricosus TaxID=182803 RepID=A0A4Y2A4K1_ARAVE|nr:hypothetical protein AVEN_235325-1 [Araneus ventricosus]